VILFLDTEFNKDEGRGRIDLLSIALASADGRHEIYLECSGVDPNLCTAFVRANVLPWMGKNPSCVAQAHGVGRRLRAFFGALPRGVHDLACDNLHDTGLLAAALGKPWPRNLHPTRIHLEDLTEVEAFSTARRLYHEAPGRPYHHSLWDARGLRAGYLAWKEDTQSHRAALRLNAQKPEG
jgi:hypothetical protein